MKPTLLTLLLIFVCLISFGQSYHMPEETETHEGTWLQWPHQYTYGMFYRNSMDITWLAMTEALAQSENVHIVAYNNTEKNRIIQLLNNASIDLSNIDFYVHANDDVWVRDNGPIFVYDENNQLHITDWGFNGWGNDAPYDNCDNIPSLLATDLNVEVIDLSNYVLEGGAIEHDGHGTMMATKSSVTHESRNPNVSQEELEQVLSTYLGFEKFIWLEGVYGQEITDMHIDGVMKFANSNVILTMNNEDLLYWGLTQSDIDILYSATNINGEAYEFGYLPLTQNDVTTTYGNNLGYKGCYANYYIANNVVLVPNYNDPNDAIANNIIQSYYPNRTVVGIDVRDLYEYGGMVHCVTQQQMPELVVTTQPSIKTESPFFYYDGVIQFIDGNDFLSIDVYDLNGRKVDSQIIQSNFLQLHIKNSGLYFIQLTDNKGNITVEKIIVN